MHRVAPPSGGAGQPAGRTLAPDAGLDRGPHGAKRPARRARRVSLERGGDPLERGGRLGPDIELWHYMGVASVELTDPVRSRWEIVLHGGAGGTRVEGDATERFEAASSDEPTLLAAVDGGYDVSPHVTLFFRADGYLIFGDSPAPDTPPYLGKEVVLTHTGGLRISF